MMNHTNRYVWFDLVSGCSALLVCFSQLGKVRLSANVLLNSLILAEMIKIQPSNSLILPSA